MAAPGTTGQYSKLVDPAVRSIFVDTYKQVASNFEKAFVVEDQRDQTEQESLYSGVGGLATVAEGGTYTEDAPLQMYTTSYVDTKYGKRYSLSEEVELWEKTNLVKKMPELAAKAAARKVEVVTASVYNNGFSTSYTSYGDGKPAFSTLHTRVDGGTAQSNASATGITLTDANLETGMIALEEALDDRGQLIDAYADTLLVPPQLRKEALVITKSEKKSGVADNDVNVYGMEEYMGAAIQNVVCWKYLGAAAGGSDTAWYLLARNNPAFAFKVKWGLKPRIDRDDSVGFSNGLIYWKVRLHLSTGWSDWRAAWGSKGDGGAYAS